MGFSIQPFYFLKKNKRRKWKERACFFSRTLFFVKFIRFGSEGIKMLYLHVGTYEYLSDTYGGFFIKNSYFDRKFKIKWLLNFNIQKVLKEVDNLRVNRQLKIIDNDGYKVSPRMISDGAKSIILMRELLRLIEVGASCFNHYCVGYDVTQLNVLHNVHRRISLG